MSQQAVFSHQAVFSQQGLVEATQRGAEESRGEMWRGERWRGERWRGESWRGERWRVKSVFERIYHSVKAAILLQLHTLVCVCVCLSALDSTRKPN